MILISISFSIPSASQNLTTEARVSASRKWKKLLFTPWMMSLSLETFRFQMDAILAKKIKQLHWQYFVLGKNFYCLIYFCWSSRVICTLLTSIKLLYICVAYFLYILYDSIYMYFKIDLLFVYMIVDIEVSVVK